METRLDDTQLEPREIWLWSGTHYDDTYVLSVWPERMFRDFTGRLAREAGINLQPMKGLAEKRSHGPKDARALLPFLMACCLGTEVASDEAHEAAAAIQRIVKTWPADDPMLEYVREMITGLSEVSDLDYIGIS